jgi:hypothetical protein
MGGIGSEGGVEPLKSSNTSGLKRVSGDNAAGLDAPTMNKFTETLVVDGKIMDMRWLNDLNNDAKLRISIEPPSSATDAKRSNMLNELVTGIGNMDAENLNTMTSLGSMMCKIMVLMIVSTTDQRNIERESQLELSQISFKTSQDKTAAMMKMADMVYKKMMVQAWSGLAQTAIRIGAGAVAAKVSTPKKPKDYGVGNVSTSVGPSAVPQSVTKKQPFTYNDFTSMENARRSAGDVSNMVVKLGLDVTQAILGKNENQAAVKEKEAMVNLIDNLASRAGECAKRAQKAQITLCH